MSEQSRQPANKRYEDHARKVADQLINLMEQGLAPWQKEWDAGQSAFSMPYNALSGRQYTGGNSIHLMATAFEQGWEDPRWMTFHQIQKAGLRVRKGEKGTKVVVWDFSKVKGAKGDQSEEGEEESKDAKVKYPGPSFYPHWVFNGAQVEGMPELKARQISSAEWRHNECERLLADSGANIQHNGGDRAFYRPATDSIHLPEKEAFHSGDAYYATALHELGHWTGHKDRLGRDLSGSFGSESYAKEELRAEIGSMMAGDRLGIGHDPSRHAAYVQHWVKILKDDPKEIFRAAKDAEAICTHLKIEAYQHEPIEIQECKQEAAPEQVEEVAEVSKRTARARKEWSPRQNEGARLHEQLNSGEGKAPRRQRREHVQTM